MCVYYYTIAISIYSSYLLPSIYYLFAIGINLMVREKVKKNPVRHSGAKDEKRKMALSTE